MIQRVFDEISKWWPWSATGRVVCLGAVYDGSSDYGREEFLEDFCSRVLLTYRRGSTPLRLVGEKEITSDAGWGCMLRVIQMMLAQGFSNFTLGRAWRFQAAADLQADSVYLKLVSCFLDSPQAPFSLHKLVDAGQQMFGKAPSTWFGPTSAAQAAGRLFEATSESGEGADVPEFVHRLACVVFQDGAIFKDRVLEKLKSEGCEAVIILLCRRLGLDAFNAEMYRGGIQACFELPQFLGMASGNGSSAHFFVASHGDELLFLDPHTTRPALESIDDVLRTADPGLRPTRPLPLRWPRLNPSVCLGFFISSEEEFLSLCEILCDDRHKEVFEVLEKEPVYGGDFEETEDGDVMLLG